MRCSQEELILKFEETLQSNTSESSLSSADTPSPKRAQASLKSDADSIVWATVDVMIKENNSEPDFDYIYNMRKDGSLLSWRAQC